MNRTTIINSIIAVLIVGGVAALFVVDSRAEQSASTTTTTSTTSTTVPTTTTTSTTSTTTTTTSSTTSTPSTSSTVPPTTEVPLPRGLWKVIVVNGSSSGERLAPTVEALEALGYEGVRGLVGAVQATETVVYYQFDGQQSAADRLRVDLGLDSVRIAPFEEAPPVAGRNDAQVILYLGGS